MSLLQASGMQMVSLAVMCSHTDHGWIQLWCGTHPSTVRGPSEAKVVGLLNTTSLQQSNYFMSHTGQKCDVIRALQDYMSSVGPLTWSSVAVWCPALVS
jgi:hypothetical protein